MRRAWVGGPASSRIAPRPGVHAAPSGSPTKIEGRMHLVRPARLRAAFWALALLMWPLLPGEPRADDGQWIMPSKDYENTRYSGLDQIATKNVKDLKVAWTFSTGVNRGQEAAPLVVGDTMYVVTPYPNILYALDLKDAGRGPLEVRAQALGLGAGRGLLRHGQPRLRLRRRPDLLQHPRLPHRRGGRRDRQGGLEDEARRDQPRRDDDHGPPGGQGEGAGRQQRRRARGPGLDHRPRRQDGQDRLDGPTAPAPTPIA